MNFTSPTDFKYVTGDDADRDHPNGDLDRIEIDNDIMPVRTGDEARNIRGIDIAFLMEATEERARAIGLEEVEFTFSRSIDKDQVNQIIDRYNEIVDKQDENMFFDFYVDANEVSEKFSTATEVSGGAHVAFCALELDYIQPSGDVIESDKILEIFLALEKLDTIRRGNITQFESLQMAAGGTVIIRRDNSDFMDRENACILTIGQGYLLASQMNYTILYILAVSGSVSVRTGVENEFDENDPFSFGTNVPKVIAEVRLHFAYGDVDETYSAYMAVDASEENGVLNLNVPQIFSIRDFLTQKYGFYRKDYEYQHAASDCSIRSALLIYELSDRTRWNVDDN